MPQSADVSFEHAQPMFLNSYNLLFQCLNRRMFHLNVFPCGVLNVPVDVSMPQSADVSFELEYPVAFNEKPDCFNASIGGCFI